MGDSINLSETELLLARVAGLRAAIDPAVRFVETQEPHIRDYADKADQEKARGYLNSFTRALAEIGVVRLSGNGAQGTLATPSDVHLLEKRVRQLLQALAAAKIVMDTGASHIREFKDRAAQEQAYAQRKAYLAALENLRTERATEGAA